MPGAPAVPADLGDASSPWAPTKQTEEDQKVSAEQARYREEFAKRQAKEKEERAKDDEPEARSSEELAGACKSEFHGHEKVDYQGRAWSEPPSALKPSEDHDAFFAQFGL